MSFKHNSFLNSPVMQELEKIAAKKGMIKPETLKKEASQKEDYLPGKDLFSDIVRLASGLRQKGLVKQANALENKLLNFKTAEVHLYRAIDEDGDDVINTAHPDGEVKVEEAKDGNGIVETQLTQHKKMVDVVNKNPTGKYAGLIDNVLLDVAEVLDIDLKKKAQRSTEEELKIRIKSAGYMLNKIVSGFIGHIRFDVSPLNEYFGFYINYPGIIKDLAIPATLLAAPMMAPLAGLIVGKEVKAEKSVILARKIPKAVYQDKESTRKLWELYLLSAEKPMTWPEDFLMGHISFGDLSDTSGIDKVNSVVDRKLEEVKNVFAKYPQTDITPESAKEYVEAIRATIKDPIMDIILAQMPQTKRTFEKYLTDIQMDATQLGAPAKKQEPGSAYTGEDYSNPTTPIGTRGTNIVYNRYRRLASTLDKHPNVKQYAAWAAGIAKILQEAGPAKPYAEVYKSLIAFDKDLANFKSLVDLDKNAISWENYLKKLGITLEATKDDNALIAVGVGAPPSAPTVAPQVSTPARPFGTGRKSTLAEALEPERSAVVRMQEILRSLGSQLLKSDDVLKSKFNVKSIDYIHKMITLLLSTGEGERGKTRDAVDGKWGTNTKNALEAAQDLMVLGAHKELGGALVIGPLYNPNKTGEEVKRDAARADANTKIIAQFMEKLGLELPAVNVPTGKTVDYYDILETKKMGVNEWLTGPYATSPTGGVVLGAKDLDSFSKLNAFMKLHGLTVPFTHTSQTPEEQLSTTEQDYSLANWGTILKLFYQRATKQLQQVKDNIEKNRKEKYREAIGTLYYKLMAASEGLNKDTVLTVAQLDSKGGGGKAAPISGTSSQLPGGVSPEGSEYSVSHPGALMGKEVISMPFDENVDLIRLRKDYPESYSEVEEDLSLLKRSMLNIRLFYNTRSLEVAKSLLPIAVPPAPAYNAGPEYTEYVSSKYLLLRLYKVVQALHQLLQSVVAEFDKRRSDPRYTIPSNIVKAQVEFWNEWSERLSVTLQRISRDYKELTYRIPGTR